MARKTPRLATNPLTAIAYIRVSTDTDRQALGVEAQRAAIEAWALRGRIDVLAWHIESVSGGAALDARPVLLAAMADVAAHGAGRLVVAKLDRFSRDPMTAGLAEAELQRHGATLAIADGNGEGDDPTAEMVRGMLLVVGRFEKAMIRARVRAALAVKRGRGEMTGNAPFGYRAVEGPTRIGKDGVERAVPVLEIDMEEQAAIAKVRELRAGGMSLRDIEFELASLGIVGRKGRPLKLPTIHAIAKTAG